MIRSIKYLSLRCMLVACGAAMFLGCAQELEANENVIVIDPTQRKQQITLIGGDIERSQGNLQRAANVEELVQLGFVDIPFTVCRVSYDKQQERKEGHKNFEFYDDAIKSMQMIKAARPDMEFWATMKSDYSGYHNSNNLPEWICDYRPNTRFDCAKYAGFLADYLELMEKSGVAIDYLSTAKEWTQTVTPLRARDIILNLNAECERRGIRQPKYIDAATWSVAQGERYVRSVEKLDMVDLYYGMATHNYGNNGKYNYDRFVDMSSKLGLLTFADESSFGSGGRAYGNDPEKISAPIRSYRDRCAFYESGMVGEIFFEIYSRGSDPESRAIYIPSKGDRVGYPLRIYYIAKRFVNSLAGGKYYTPYDYSNFEQQDKVYTMAFTSDDELFVCVINDRDEAVDDLRIAVGGDVRCGRPVDFTTFDAEMPREGVSSRTKTRSNTVDVDLTPHSISFINIKLK